MLFVDQNENLLVKIGWVKGNVFHVHLRTPSTIG